MEKMRWIFWVMAIIGCVVFTLALLVSVVMLPFVNVLPYLHTTTLWHRSILVGVFFIFFCVALRLALTNKQWNLVRALTLQTWKDVVLGLLGFVIAIYSVAALSANTLGILTKIFPGEVFVQDLIVLSKESIGPKYRALKLELQSPQNQQVYQIRLSGKVFGDLPEVERGDVLRIEGTRNSFGSYVTHFSVSPKRTNEVRLN